MKKLFIITLILGLLLTIASCSKPQNILPHNNNATDYTYIEDNFDSATYLTFKISASKYMNAYVDVIKTDSTGEEYGKIHTDGLEDWYKYKDYLVSFATSWQNTNIYQLDHFDSSIPSNRNVKKAMIWVYEESNSGKLIQIKVKFTEYINEAEKNVILGYIFDSFGDETMADDLQKKYAEIVALDSKLQYYEEYAIGYVNSIKDDEEYFYIRAINHTSPTVAFE